MAYEIAKYRDVFIKSDNLRSMKNGGPIPWCSHPNGFTSRGYHALLDACNDVDAMAFYGVFCQLVKLSSQGKPYGVLAHSDETAFSTKFIARTIGINADLVERAIKTLVAVGWLTGCGQAAGTPPAGGPTTGQDSTEQDSTGHLGATASPKSKRFQPPTVAEVAAYCSERGNGIDPERFVSHYETNGWMRGKSKIKDWKACVRTWEQNEDGRQGRSPGRRLSSAEQRELANAEAFDAVFGPDESEGVAPGAGNSLFDENPGESDAASTGNVGGHVVNLSGGSG